MEKSKVEDLAKLVKNGEITVRHLTGTAEKFLDPVEPIKKQPLQITGSIDTVFAYLQTRSNLLMPKSCNIAIDSDNYKITLTANDQCANNEYKTIIIGKIEASKDYKELFLVHNYTTVELARLLRTKRHLFKNSVQFKKIYAELSSFKAEVNKEIERLDNKRRNAVNLIRQKVIHNISSRFTLEMKLFKGADKLTFDVEIDIDPDDLECSLFAPDLENLARQQAEGIMQQELDKDIGEIKMKEFCFCYKL